MTHRHPGRRESGEDRATEERMLAGRVFSVKKQFLAMYKNVHAGHVGSSLSCAELLVMLRFAWMRVDDTLLLSKGHAAAALYALLVESGQIPLEQLDTYYREGTHLPALPPVNALPGIPFATGSLGHGLSLAAGMGTGAVLNRSEKRIFCVTSDGELNEGSTWEAALFIAHRRLTNVVWVIDRNRIQGIGRTEDVLALDPLDAKLRAFGFHVVTARGHDLAKLLDARDEGRAAVELEDASRRRPVVIIAETIKGYGLGPTQDTVDSHYLPMDDAQYAQIVADVTATYEAAMKGAGHAE